MSDANQESMRQVLIASANPLFARGLQKLMAQHWGDRNVAVRLASNMVEVTAVLETWQPDLVIVDYEEVGGQAGKSGHIQRKAFLTYFIAEDRPMRVMLVSLRASGEVVVYDRRTLTPAQAEDWLDQPWDSTSGSSSLPIAVTGSAGKTNSTDAGAARPASENARLDVSASEDAAAPAGAPATAGAGAPGSVPDRAAKTRLKFSGPRSGGMKHYIVPSILTIVFTFIIALVLQGVGLMPAAASVQAGPIDGMIDLQLWIISFLFSLIVVFMLYSIVVFRNKRNQLAAGAYFKGSTSLEIAWTILPLGTVIFLSFIGARDLAAIRRPDPNALEVKVTAFQWGWSFKYPDTGVISNQLYLPVNRQVHLVMTSKDVIHSFWVPEFRVKQDILPGDNLVKELRITPNRIGQFTVYCNQLCGGAHAYMTAPVKVVSQQDFDAWMAEQSKASTASPADRGAAVAKDTGCLACHSPAGAKMIGPTWKDLAGSQVKLADGSTVTADDVYLHDSIVDPNKQIAAGFAPGLMPQTYKSLLTDQQISDLIAYIKTLK